MTKNLILLVSAAALMTACASKPEVVEQEPEPVAAAPIFTPEPEPKPVMQAPVQQQTVVQSPDPNLPVPGSVADFIYQAGGDARVYFGYNQYNLTPSAMDNLRAQAAWLKQYNSVNAVIEGNADERGTREYNLALGARRAESVKSFLVGQGVASRRLTTVSYGKERPIDGRSSESGWARNRNGHTNVMNGAVG